MLSQVLSILRCAAMEQLRGSKKPAQRDDLPSSFADINIGWLDKVLCVDVPGARVVGFKLVDGTSGTTNRVRIWLDYNEAGREAGLPATLFLKGTMSLSSRFAGGLTGAMLSECEFYRSIRSKLAIEAPTARHAAYDAASCVSLVVLDDLSATRGAEFCGPDTYIDRRRAEELVTLLAGFHGRFGNARGLREIAVLPEWETLFRTISRVAMIGTYGNKGLLTAGEPAVPLSLLKRYKQIWPATLRATELGRAAPRSLTHADVHIKNWYMTRGGTQDGALGLADWQCATRGPWSRDLAYALAAALTIDDRRSWEQELIKLYLEKLREAGGERHSFKETFVHYRQQLLSALALWTPVLTPPPYMPAMQPAAVSMAYITRITHAMDDLDSLKAVGA